VATNLDPMGRAPAGPSARPTTELSSSAQPAGWLVGAAVALVTVLLLLPTIIVRLQPPELREPGEWRFTHRLEPVPGMTVIRRILTADQELTILRSDADVAQCTVDLTRSTGDVTQGQEEPPRTTTARSVRIRGWTGRYVDGRSQDPYVTWGYAPGGRATVTCTRGAIPAATLLATAKAVHFEDAPIRLPFTFDALPEAYRIYSLDQDTSSRDDVLSVSLQPVDGASLPSIVVRYGSDEAAYRCLGDPHTGTTRARSTTPRSGRVCLTPRWSAEDAPGAGDIVRQSLDRVAERIELSADPADPRTWFDAIDLPR
jgi:hypothetical protein